MTRPVLSILILFLSFNFLSAQTDNEPAEELTLTEQFKAFRADADIYGEYKVIKATKLNSFWSVIEDSLAVKNTAISDNATTIITLNSTISDLEESLSTTTVSLEESKAESASLSVLGMQVDKNNFVIAFWIITIILVAALVVMTIKYTQSNIITRRTLKDNDAQSTEINDLRHKYMDREIVLKRELQTERNKVEELRNKVMA